MATAMFLHAFLLGIAGAIMGVTVNVIMPNEKILNWWFRIGEKVGKEIVHGQEKERLIFRPIWGCEKCFSGQLAFWIYFFSHIRPNEPIYWEANGWFSFPGYSLIEHALAVCTAILSAVILSYFIHIIKNTEQ